MARISIQPDIWEHRMLLFFTDPEKLVSENAVDAKIKKIVLVILHWIVRVLTLNLLTLHCTDKRDIIEFKMRREMMDTIEEKLGFIISEFLYREGVLVDHVRDELSKIDGLSENVLEYVLSLLPIEKLNMSDDEKSKCLEKIISRLYKVLIFPKKDLEDCKDLIPLGRSDRSELFKDLNFIGNRFCDDDLSEIDSSEDEDEGEDEDEDLGVRGNESIELNKKDDNSYPIQAVYDSLISFWEEYENSRNDAIKNKHIGILALIDGVSQKRAKNLIDVTIALEEVHRQAIINNFKMIVD